MNPKTINAYQVFSALHEIERLHEYIDVAYLQCGHRHLQSLKCLCLIMGDRVASRLRVNNGYPSGETAGLLRMAFESLLANNNPFEVCLNNRPVRSLDYISPFTKFYVPEEQTAKKLELLPTTTSGFGQYKVLSMSLKKFSACLSSAAAKSANTHKTVRDAAVSAVQMLEIMQIFLDYSTQKTTLPLTDLARKINHEFKDCYITI